MTDYPDELMYVLLGLAGIPLAYACVRLIWRWSGVYLIKRAGPRQLVASEHRIWRDPGRVEDGDLAAGPGGASGEPRPPFQFLEEHASGSQPCVSVRDEAGRRWRIKWGHEVQPESFAVRFAWATGYFGEVTYFVPSGLIEGAKDLQRARDCVGDDCRFADARFELDDPAVRKLFDEHSWAWDDNPFVGTPELTGLKIVVMLLSNWDTKDRRDVARGSNTAIFEYAVSRRRREAQYLITDWGGAMGRWGSNIVTRGRWDAAGFEAQTPQFVTGVENGIVSFGYAGQRTADVAAGIEVEHVRWFHRYAGRLTERQLHAGLMASGATAEEAPVFARALIARIAQLGAGVDAQGESPA